MFDPQLQQCLTGDAGLTALVGASIFQGTAPQTIASPYVVWWDVFGMYGLNLACPPETKSARIQIDCFSSQQKQARLIKEAVCTAIWNAGQGEVINDYCEPFGDVSRFYRWIVEVEFVLNS
jgi:Protein of unknown function (DUF3168)